MKAFLELPSERRRLAFQQVKCGYSEWTDSTIHHRESAHRVNALVFAHKQIKPRRSDVLFDVAVPEAMLLRIGIQKERNQFAFMQK